MLVTVTTLSEYETFYFHFQDETSESTTVLSPPASGLKNRKKISAGDH